MAINNPVFAPPKRTACLPFWLDSLLFNSFGARYNTSNKDLVVLDWGKDMMLSYLGTYFPRSYTEAFCIFSDYFKRNKAAYKNKYRLDIFDFGCGTGGEIVGMVLAAMEAMPSIKCFRIKGLDGNALSLRYLEKILANLSSRYEVEIDFYPVSLMIEDFYDMDVLEQVLGGEYDVIISFKSICEFVSKQEFEGNNPYEYITKAFFPKLSRDGILCLADITSFNDVAKEWLSNMLDAAARNYGVIVMNRNSGYNEVFYTSHSHKEGDKSKLAWRIIKKNQYEERLDDQRVGAG